MKVAPITLLALSLPLVTACAGAEEPAPAVEAEPAAMTAAAPAGDGTRENPYVGRGVITEVGETQLVIDHGVIPGWMGAMQMAFPVTEEVDLTGLAAGDAITFNVELEGVMGYQVFQVEPIEE